MQRRVRFVRPARNALRRRSDRIESALVAALLAFFVLAGPAAAMVAGSVADHDMLGQVRAEQSWHPVRATLTHPGARRLQASASNWVVQSAEASWTAGGRTHTGWIPLAAPPGQARTASVWVNSAGTPTGPPSAYANLHLVIGLAALCAVLIVAGILFLAAVATRFVLNRRRMSGWDTAWRAIGPQWTRQL
jgi:hypothetical protein